MKKKQSIPPTVIVYQRLGQTCIRQRPTHVSNPNSPKQLRQREKFALAVAAAKEYAPLLDSKWHYYARRHHKTGLNLLVGHILRRAIAEDPSTGHPTFDPTKLDLHCPWR